MIRAAPSALDSPDHLGRDAFGRPLADKAQGKLLATRQVAVGRRGFEQGFQWDSSRGLGSRVEWFRLALRPGPQPKARRPLTRLPSTREARAKANSSDLRGQHP